LERIYALSIKKEGYQNIEAIDLCQDDIDYAKSLTNIENIFCENVFEYLKNIHNQYDIIISTAVMEHLPKERQGEFVELLHNSLKKDRICIISVPNMDWLFSNHERYMDFTHEIGYTRESFADMFYLRFNNVEVLPEDARYEKYSIWKQRFIDRVLYPLTIKALKLMFRILSEGMNGLWFQYRSIFCVARK